ncbi:MAG: S41 family peptidase [bacterium]
MKLSLYNPKRLTFIALVLVISSAMLGTKLERAFSSDNSYEELQKYSEVLNLVQKNYVDKVNLGDLNVAAINGLLAKLDPHSVYMSPVSVKQSAEDFHGSFEGIGVRFQMAHDSILIEEVIVGGPSEAVGLNTGDKIFSIDGKRTSGYTQDSVIKHLRGPKGTKVNVMIARPGTPASESGGGSKPLSFEITRDVIPLNSVLAHFMVDANTGYIYLSHFIETSHSEMVKALEELKGLGMKRLILDLRGNPGGYLEQAVQIVDEFVGGNKTIVYTKGRVAGADDVDISHPGQQYEQTPLVVLVNSSSASASEITSGAFQDLDRAPIVGATTFGKGLVQRQYALNDGSSVRLTVARYYTPSGRSIQRPYDGGKYKKAIENDEADEEDNFSHTKDVNANDTTRPKFKTPSGRTIYGGGGITPDYFVKEDTVTRSTIRVFGAAIPFDYTRDLISNRGAELKKQYTAETFVNSYKLTDDIIKKFYATAKEKKIECDMKELEADKTWILNKLRADLGGLLFGDNVRYKIYLETDKQFNKAYSIVIMDEAAKMAQLSK